jgi:phosphopantothenoylcysteine decarboxylase/phosphopantothenate--cysteine ligase
MHTEMWLHPATVTNVDLLATRGVRFVGPDDGPLMGGDTGPGRAVPAEVVVARVADLLATSATRDFEGRSVLVTAGGTREPIDPVRFLGNRSTGRMGFALAEAAAARGADVVLVAAPTHLPTPDRVERVDVTTARDMHDAVMGLALEQDVVIKAAAVADFRPASPAEQKLKKASGVPEVALVPNPDILLEVADARRAGAALPHVLVGFAAETHDVLAQGRAKLERKGCDLLVVNDVSAESVGFGHDTNRVTILDADGGVVEVPLQAKRVVADAVLDAVAKQLAT